MQSYAPISLLEQSPTQNYWQEQNRQFAVAAKYWQGEFHVDISSDYSRAVYSVAFSPDTQTLASSRNRTIKIWNLSVKRLSHTVAGVETR